MEESTVVCLVASATCRVVLLLEAARGWLRLNSSSLDRTTRAYQCGCCLASADDVAFVHFDFVYM